MSDERRGPTARERGLARMRELYGDEVREVPEGASPFTDVMLETLFAGVWDRDVLSMRDRRLLVMGVVAALGATDIWGLQARSALANGELDADELREALVLLAPYAGYPNVAPLVGPTEAAIAGRDAG